MNQARVKPPTAAHSSTTLHAGWRQLTNSRNATKDRLNSAVFRTLFSHNGSNNTSNKMPTTAALIPAGTRRHTQHASAGKTHKTIEDKLNRVEAQTASITRQDSKPLKQ